jgi:hypothetical protein
MVQTDKEKQENKDLIEEMESELNEIETEE